MKNDINDKDKGSKSWWSIVNSITGRKSTHVSISCIVSPDEINDYFCTINTDPNYIDPEILSIPDGTRIPEVTSLTVCNFLLHEEPEPAKFLRGSSVTSSNVLRKVSLQTKLNSGLSEQQQEDLFQSDRSFHEVKL